MDLSVIVAPTVEPVSALEAFLHLKLTADPQADVTGDPQYVEVMRQISSAREQCEQITRRAFMPQTLRLCLGPRRWDGERRGLAWYMNGGTHEWRPIELPRPPLVSVSSVSYFDESNYLQTIDPANYFVSAGLVPRLQFVRGFSTSALYVRDDAIQVTYEAGYSVANGVATIPASIKAAILIGVQMQSDRLLPAERMDLERARDSLLSSFRVHTH